MNDRRAGDQPVDLEDVRLGRAVRSVLGDVVAKAPDARHPPSTDRTVSPSDNRWRRRSVFIAAGLTAAAGVVGIVVVTDDGMNRSFEAEPPTPHAVAPPTVPDGVTPYLPDPTAPFNDEVVLPPGPADSAEPESPATAPAAPPPSTADASPCGAATIPADAADVQTVSGDIDGDAVADTVTLYSAGGQWYVNSTSSVKGWASDTTVTIDVHDTMSLSLENIDYSAGAEVPPPVVIMVTGAGSNDRGILANFTFLTNTTDYCVEQWTYQPPDRDVEPFQWVALQEPGHVTGMICEGAAGSRYYSLVDSEQNADGSWTVITRLLTHDFTRAEITFEPEQTIPDSPDFVDQYGNIVGCDHPAV